MGYVRRIGCPIPTVVRPRQPQTPASVVTAGSVFVYKRGKRIEEHKKRAEAQKKDDGEDRDRQHRGHDQRHR